MKKTMKHVEEKQNVFATRRTRKGLLDVLFPVFLMTDSTLQRELLGVSLFLLFLRRWSDAAPFWGKAEILTNCGQATK